MACCKKVLENQAQEDGELTLCRAVIASLIRLIVFYHAKNGTPTKIIVNARADISQLHPKRGRTMIVRYIDAIFDGF